MTARRRVEVAVVGGGPAGALTASLLAQAGRDVSVFERAPGYRWRACGVFASPAALGALRAAGVDEPTLRRVARPIPAMRVETMAGSRFGLAYGADIADPRSWAVGFDRSALDPALLERAREAGADVHEGADVERLDLGDGRRIAELTVRTIDGPAVVEADLVVGADGIRSTVARAAAVARPARLGRRIGLTWHVRETDGAIRNQAARMVVLDGAYCGLAPVPGGRINVGLVLAGGAWRARLRREGAESVAGAVLADIATDSAAENEVPASPLDSIAGAAPLGHRVSRRTGRRWLLVGDAAGFLDPFTGEGLHRAIVSAVLAAEAVDDHIGGRARSFDGYERAMRNRFAAKDLVSWLVQAFLSRPALFEYAARRLANRDTVRERLGLVMGDLAPASAGLDPRFLAALLAP